MCDTCGCNVTDGNRHLVEAGGRTGEDRSGREAVDVLQDLLSENDHQAAHNREHFDRHGVLAINLMSSPGSGKTALLEATIDALGTELTDRRDRGRPGNRKRRRAHPRQGRAGGADHHRHRLPPRRAHGARGAASAGPRRRRSSCSSRTSAIWSARPVSISASTATSPCCRSPRATTSRPSTR